MLKTKHGRLQIPLIRVLMPLKAMAARHTARIAVSFKVPAISNASPQPAKTSATPKRKAPQCDSEAAAFFSVERISLAGRFRLANLVKRSSVNASGKRLVKVALLSARLTVRTSKAVSFSKAFLSFSTFSSLSRSGIRTGIGEVVPSASLTTSPGKPAFFRFSSSSFEVAFSLLATKRIVRCMRSVATGSKSGFLAKYFSISAFSTGQSISWI